MGDKRVKKIVIVMRHGIRAPNQSQEKLSEWSSRPWPVWPVKPGYLTSRGRELVTVLWRMLRDADPYKRLLFSNGRCLSSKDVFIHADIDERTQSTAAVFARALAPSCTLPYYITTEQKLDPVFHPVQENVCQKSRVEAEEELIDLVDSSFGELAKQFSSQLDFVTNLLGPMPVLTCKEYGVKGECQLKDLPPRINFANSGRTVNLRGAMGIKATLIQNWLLEAAQWPDRVPAWGELCREKLEELLVARAAVFNSLNRADGYSRDHGSTILRSITDALRGEHVDPRVNDARMVVYVGHDTNMAHISDLLGIEWKLDTYCVNDIPPGSFMQFVLWEDSARQKIVTADLIAQPLDVLLCDKPENAERQYMVEPLFFRERKASGMSVKKEFYQLDEFSKIVQSVVSSECVLPVGSLKYGKNH